MIGGRYRLASLAGRNGLDALYDAHDEATDARVRVRLTAQPVDPDLARVQTPGAPAVLAHGHQGRWSWSAHAWFDGRPLRLDPDPTPSEAHTRFALRIGVDLLDTLQQAHETSGRAHGNLGLHSLWLGDDGHPRIVDLAAPQGVLTSDALLYASPERLRGLPRTPAGDVYSVAAIVWALLTGAPPFGGEPIDARSGHLLKPLPDHPDVPVELALVLSRAMAKAPSDRPESAAALAGALRGLAGRALTPPPPTGRRLQPHPAAPLHSEDSLPVLLGPLVAEGTLEPVPARAPTRRPARHLALLSAIGGFLGGGLAGLVLVMTIGVVLLWWVRPALVEALSTEPTADAVQIEPAAVVADDAAAPADDAAPGAIEATPEPPPIPSWEVVPVLARYDTWEVVPMQGFDRFTDDVRAWPGPVRLTGHTDSTGSARANEVLGLGRAWAVQQLLVLRGIDEARLPLESAGETAPVASDDTAAGRAANRRVEATFEAPQGADE